MNKAFKKLERAYLNPQNVTKEELISLARHFGMIVLKDRGVGGNYVAYDKNGKGYTIPSTLKTYAVRNIINALWEEYNG